jgi:hypothetical protein
MLKTFIRRHPARQSRHPDSGGEKYMDHMRKHKLSPRATSTHLNNPAARKRPTRSAINSARDGILVVNEVDGFVTTQGFSQYSRCLAATIDGMKSDVECSETLSIEAILQEVLVTQLIGICQALRGAKILTVCRDHDASFTARVSEDGKIADGQGYTRMLRSELNLALTNGGTFIIRQLLPMKTRNTTPDGETNWNPWKNVYAFYLGNGMFEAIPTDHLNYANSIGPDGKPVAREKGILFCEYRKPAHMSTC